MYWFMAQPVRSMALRSSARLQTAHRVTGALWSLTSHGRGAHLSWGSLPARKSSSDQSAAILIVLPCSHSRSKDFSSTSLQCFL